MISSTSGNNVPVEFKIVKQDEELQGKWRLACRGDLQEENMHAVKDVFENCHEEYRSVNSLIYLNSTRLDRKKSVYNFKRKSSINWEGKLTIVKFLRFNTSHKCVFLAELGIYVVW